MVVLKKCVFAGLCFVFEPLLGLMQKSLKYCCCTITAVASICAVQSDHLRCFTALFRELLCSFGGNISHAFSGGIYKKISILQKKISKRGVNEYIYVSVGAVK